MKYIILFLVSAIIGAVSGCGRGFSYSDGFRVGSISKFSKRGIFCKTWEGQLNVTTKQGFVADTVTFSVDIPQLVPVITKAAESGDRIKLTYNEGRFTGPCYSSSHRFVEKIEIL